MSKAFAIEILLKNFATEEQKKVMTYSMTTPIGPVTPNEWTCRKAHVNIKNLPNIQYPCDRLAKNNVRTDVGFCAKILINYYVVLNFTHVFSLK